MTRFILSLMVFVFVLSRQLPAGDAKLASIHRTAPNSKGASLAQVSTETARPSIIQSSKNIALTSIKRAASSVNALAEEGKAAVEGRLARLTAYWSGEGDYYTRRKMSSTGIRLHSGHCAVDPSVIPYGSVVQIAGLGNYLAVDTGTAVVSRRAAREAGHNHNERNALVIDLYFENRRDGEAFAANGPKYASISWSMPSAGTDINFGSPSPEIKTTPKVSTPKPLAKRREVQVVVSTPSSKHTLAVTSSKPVPTCAIAAASVKPVSKPETPVASAKSVSKRDTKNTGIIASKTPRNGTKVGTFKPTLKPEPQVAATKPAPKNDAAERILLAQNDNGSHHKPLYQF